MMAEEAKPDEPVISTGCGPGRPPVQERGVTVNTWLRESDYDRLIRVANKRGESVSALVRSLLLRRLPPR